MDLCRMPFGRRWNAAKFDVLAWVIYVDAIGVEPDEPHNLSMLHLALFWARVPLAA